MVTSAWSSMAARSASCRDALIQAHAGDAKNAVTPAAVSCLSSSISCAVARPSAFRSHTRTTHVGALSSYAMAAAARSARSGRRCIGGREGSKWATVATLHANDKIKRSLSSLSNLWWSTVYGVLRSVDAAH